MRELIWRGIAAIITRPAIARRLIARAKRTPYFHLTRPDGSVYMERFWLFNAYQARSDGEGKRWPWLPSIRIHHIAEPDRDLHLHDHPWNARTIVLDGWYVEERPWDALDDGVAASVDGMVQSEDGTRGLFNRARGYTGRLLFGEFHRIAAVSSGGVWTLFITWGTRGTWGFDVDGEKVPWRDYLEYRGDSYAPKAKPSASMPAPRLSAVAGGRSSAPSCSSSAMASSSHDPVWSNPLHPLNPISPLSPFHAAHSSAPAPDPAPSTRDYGDSCSSNWGSSSSSYDSGGSSYDGGGGSCGSFD